MNKAVFDKNKEELSNLIIDFLKKEEVSDHDKTSLSKLLQLLAQYSFENRAEFKGLLSHTVLDSLDLDYSIGEKILKFDDDI